MQQKTETYLQTTNRKGCVFTSAFYLQILFVAELISDVQKAFRQLAEELSVAIAGQVNRKAAF